jgi:hypothetical protein
MIANNIQLTHFKYAMDYYNSYDIWQMFINKLVFIQLTIQNIWK